MRLFSGRRGMAHSWHTSPLPPSQRRQLSCLHCWHSPSSLRPSCTEGRDRLALIAGATSVARLPSPAVPPCARPRGTHPRVALVASAVAVVAQPAPFGGTASGDRAARWSGTGCRRALASLTLSQSRRTTPRIFRRHLRKTRCLVTPAAGDMGTCSVSAGWRTSILTSAGPGSGSHPKRRCNRSRQGGRRHRTRRTCTGRARCGGARLSRVGRRPSGPCRPAQRGAALHDPNPATLPGALYAAPI